MQLDLPLCYFMLLVQIMHKNNLIRFTTKNQIYFKYLRRNLGLSLAAPFCNKKYKNSVTKGDFRNTCTLLIKYLMLGKYYTQLNKTTYLYRAKFF